MCARRVHKSTKMDKSHSARSEVYNPVPPSIIPGKFLN